MSNAISNYIDAIHLPNVSRVDLNAAFAAAVQQVIRDGWANSPETPKPVVHMHLGGDGVLCGQKAVNWHLDPNRVTCPDCLAAMRPKPADGSQPTRCGEVWPGVSLPCQLPKGHHGPHSDKDQAGVPAGPAELCKCNKCGHEFHAVPGTICELVDGNDDSTCPGTMVRVMPKDMKDGDTCEIKSFDDVRWIKCTATQTRLVSDVGISCPLFAEVINENPSRIRNVKRSAKPQAPSVIERLEELATLFKGSVTGTKIDSIIAVLRKGKM